MSKFMLQALLVFVGVLHLSPAYGQTVTPAVIRWCVPFNVSSSFVESCSRVLAKANSDAQKVTFTCVEGTSSAGCMEKINKGEADVTTFDGGDQFNANRLYEIQPILTEDYGTGAGPVYYAIGVVKKAFCTATTTLADLKGKNSCHTGYGRSAGWNFPMGVLISRNIAPLINTRADVTDDAEAANALFTSICAPTTSARGPLTVGGKPALWDRTCSACKGNCTAADPYYDYSGTFRGVVEDACDIGFTKAVTVQDYSQGGASAQSWSTLPVTDFKLVCPSGGCADVSQAETCNFAKVPAHAVVASKTLASNAALRARVTEALLTAASTTDFITTARKLEGQANFVFTADTQSLKPVSALTLDALFGNTTVRAYEGIQALQKGAALSSGSAIVSNLTSSTVPAAGR